MHVQAPITFSRSGIPMIDMDHEKLVAQMQLAGRAIRALDRQGAVAVLARAVRLAEIHAQEEEEYLQRCGFEGILDIRRAHEALVVALEQLETDAAVAEPAILLARLDAVVEFMSDTFTKEAEGISRFLRRAA